MNAPLPRFGREDEVYIRDPQTGELIRCEIVECVVWVGEGPAYRLRRWKGGRIGNYPECMIEVPA